MVSTRRKTVAPDGDVPAAATQPAVSPRKTRRAAPRSQTTTVSTSNEEDRLWAQKYRAMIQQERDAANKNVVTRAVHKIKLTWHHFRISMVPFMLDPWEQALYILGIVVLFYGLVHAIQECMKISIAWPSMSTTTTTSSTTVSSWVAALKPKLLKFVNNA